MSTCPDKDIHSIYLDNELPENFKTQYESHINICSKCKAELEKMRKTHLIFKADSDSLKVDDIFLAQSFDRLQERLKYSRVITRSTPAKKIDFTKFNQYIPTAVAAAAVFAIMLPFNINSKKEEIAPASNYSNIATFQQIQPIKRTTDFSINQNQLIGQNTKAAFPISLVANESTSEANNFYATYSTSFAKQFAKSNLPLDNFQLMLENYENERTLQEIHHINKIKKMCEERKIQNCSKLLADDFFMPEFAQHNHSEPQVLIYLPSYVDISSLNK